MGLEMLLLGSAFINSTPKVIRSRNPQTKEG
jgi:hypothetical protein